MVRCYGRRRRCAIRQGGNTRVGAPTTLEPGPDRISPPKRLYTSFSDRAWHILSGGKRRPSNPRRVDSPGGTRDRVPPGVIRNPVVEYTYAKEDRVVASCDYGRVGAPLQESEGP